MNIKKGLSICDYFGGLEDPRVERTKQHLLMNILVIAICAGICGADNFTEIEEFGNCKKEWFESFLELPNGIPSHDTFARVFAAMDSERFGECFTNWIAAVNEVTQGSVVAIDGKTLRRSFDKGAEKAALHMVSAFAAETQVVLGQVQTAEKSNEITAIPKLLELLKVSGCIVTIDAMGCQKKIAEKIIMRGADYVLGLKGNQGTMESEVKEFFDYAAKRGFKGISHDCAETVGKDHGRLERRRCWSTSDIGWFEDKAKWCGLTSFGMVESERQIGEVTTTERRYYISSLDGKNAAEFAKAVRQHWGIENQLHWVLDMVYREDESRIRKGNAAANFAILRHISLNLLKKMQTKKLGIKVKRLKAGWDCQYLLQVLGI